jgi:hypothetical protein
MIHEKKIPSSALSGAFFNLRKLSLLAGQGCMETLDQALQLRMP